MQRKYYKALQHFYNESTKYMRSNDNSKMQQDLFDSEDQIFNANHIKQETIEMEHILNGKCSDTHATDYDIFSFDRRTSKRNSNDVCNPRGFFCLLVWICLFTAGVVGITYSVQEVVRRIQPRHQHGDPVMYLRFKESESLRKSESVLKSIVRDGRYSACENFYITPQWNTTFDRLQTETAIRLVDVNEDGTDDSLIGFVTTVDGYNSLNRKQMCDQVFNATFPCFGGVLAVDGRNGKEIWRHYTLHEVFSLNCNNDLDLDGIADCLCGGRGGVFEAVSGRNGTVLWSFLDARYQNQMMNLYTAQFIHDMNGDGVLEVLQIHGGDPAADPFSETRLSAIILIISGKTGVVLSASPFPDRGESYFSPVLYSVKNGTNYALLGTGGETHGGNLYIIPTHELFDGHMDKAVILLKDLQKGFMNPPILVDLNHDGTVDIVSAAFGHSVTAVDGESLQVLWSYTDNETETYSVPGVGYFNDDDVTDFLIRHNHGPLFPLYYDSVVLVLDGKTGQPLTGAYKTSGAAFSSPLTVSMEGSGNDLFLFWSVDCLGHEHIGGYFAIVEGTNVHEQSRANTCFLRFNTTSFSSLSVMNSATGFSGKTIIYSSLGSNASEQGRSPMARRRLRRRHIGEPDHGGMQQIIQTGVVTNSLKSQANELSDSFGIMFATYYMRPANVRAVLPEDLACINEYRERSKTGLVDNKVDLEENRRLGIHDSGDSAINYCLGRRGVGKDLDDQESLFKKNMNFGRMTVHRYDVTCQCPGGKTCSRVLPRREQGWSGYMGSLGNGYFVERPKSRFQITV